MVIKSEVFTSLSQFCHSLPIIKTCISRPIFIRIALLFRKILTNKAEHVKMGVNLLWLFVLFVLTYLTTTNIVRIGYLGMEIVFRDYFPCFSKETIPKNLSKFIFQHLIRKRENVCIIECLRHSKCFRRKKNSLELFSHQNFLDILWHVDTLPDIS